MILCLSVKSAAKLSEHINASALDCALRQFPARLYKPAELRKPRITRQS